MKAFMAVIYLVLFAGLAFGAYKLFQYFKVKWPGVSSWWANLFGKLPPGTPIPDTTGTAGEQASQKAFASVVNRNSQGFYNAALQQFANDNEFATSLLAQGSTNWPWTSYDSWVRAGEPHLPGEEAVYADDNGNWHNDYI